MGLTHLEAALFNYASSGPLTSDPVSPLILLGGVTALHTTVILSSGGLLAISSRRPFATESEGPKLASTSDPAALPSLITGRRPRRSLSPGRSPGDGVYARILTAQRARPSPGNAWPVGPKRRRAVGVPRGCAPGLVNHGPVGAEEEDSPQVLTASLRRTRPGTCSPADIGLIVGLEVERARGTMVMASSVSNGWAGVRPSTHSLAGASGW
jgi:hypothetical protein